MDFGTRHYHDLGKAGALEESRLVDLHDAVMHLHGPERCAAPKDLLAQLRNACRYLHLGEAAAVLECGLRARNRRAKKRASEKLMLEVGAIRVTDKGGAYLADLSNAVVQFHSPERGAALKYPGVQLSDAGGYSHDLDALPIRPFLCPVKELYRPLGTD